MVYHHLVYHSKHLSSNVPTLQISLMSTFIFNSIGGILSATAIMCIHILCLCFCILAFETWTQPFLYLKTGHVWTGSVKFETRVRPVIWGVFLIYFNNYWQLSCQAFAKHWLHSVSFYGCMIWDFWAVLIKLYLTWLDTMNFLNQPDNNTLWGSVMQGL